METSESMMLLEREISGVRPANFLAVDAQRNCWVRLSLSRESTMFPAV